MCELLPNTLRKAVDQLKKHDSIARKVLGDVFVDHYAATREHEIRLWDLAITNWEVERYLEVV
jgi:glutamine synthetase